MRGIYKIENKINGKMYIGESLNIIKRWDEHKEDLNNNRHHSYKLQNDWNTYGVDNFEFNIISVLDESISNFKDKYILLLYEYKYMMEYNTLTTGYNIENSIKMVFENNKTVYNKNDKDLINYVSNDIKNKIILECGGIIYIKSESIKYVAELLNITKGNIKDYLINEGMLKTIESKKYIMLKKDINLKYFELEDNDRYEHIRFTDDGIELLKRNIDDIPKGKKKKEAKKTKRKSPKNSDDISISKFVKQFNDNGYIYIYLRNNNILEYVTDINGKKVNMPTENYKDWFYNYNHLLKEGEYGINYLTEKGKEEIHKILIDNDFFNNK